jgi:hypothetical protein
MTKGAFKQSWVEVLRREKIYNLTFHDLRREAGSRFDAAGLTKGEHDLMMGHSNRDMTSLYVHADLKSIQDKLDRYTLGGLTFNEALEKVGAIVLNTRISGKPKAVPLEEATKAGRMEFKNEGEMKNAIERLKSEYARPESWFPFPPQI